MDELNNKVAASYDKENRGVPRLFARHIVALLAPSITEASVVHDNACGPAVVTSELIAKIPSPPKIFATDNNPAMITASEDIVKINAWNTVTVSNVDSTTLSFGDDTFSHSFTNFLIPPQPGAFSEIYRTLQPGGTAVFTAWKSHGFVALMRRCVKIIFPDAEPKSGPPMATEDFLRGQFLKAGFRNGGDIQVLSHSESLRFESLDDLMTLVEGPFGKFFTQDWNAEDLGKLPEAVKQALTAEEAESKTLELSAWIVLAKKVL